MKDMLHVCRVREVRLALPALTLSMTGDAMAFVALTLRVHASRAGPYAVATLLLCFALPVVVTMGIAGALADRVDPRVLIPAASVVQVAACAGLALAQSLAATYALVVVLQVGFAVANPTWNSVLSWAVGDDRIGHLVSVQQALMAAASPIGAALGGLLVQQRGDAVVFVLDALSYVVIGVAGLGMRRAAPPPSVSPPTTQTARNRSRTVLLPREGWAAVRANPLAWALLWALLPFVIALESMNAVEVFLVRDSLGGSAADFGYWQATTGAGALVGALAAGVLASDRQRVHAILIALTTIAAALLGIGLAPSLAWVFALGAVLGVANAVSNAGLFAVFVRGILADVRGRALALLNGLARATSLLALALGGLAGATLGPRLSFVVAGTCGLVVAARAWHGIRRILNRDEGRNDHSRAARRTQTRSL